MKKVIHFSKAFVPTVIMSATLIVAGILGLAFKGFNNGVDFQAGLNSDVQIVPQAIGLTYDGTDTYRLSVSQKDVSVLVLEKSGASKNYSFPFAQYTTVKAIADALRTVPNLNVQQLAKDDVPSTKLVASSQKDPQVGTTAVYLHNELVSKDEITVTIEKMRSATASLGSVSIQNLGDPLNQEYMIRVTDSGKDPEFSKTLSAKLPTVLEQAFGADKVVINKTDYAGASFSKDLATQSGWLTIMTFALILIYCMIRFRIDYAIGAVLSVIHDVLIMVCFIVWTRMEFNTSTIAAILTIIGYSINDTIVNYDRIREKVQLMPDAPFRDCVDLAVTECLSRTIITSVTVIMADVSIWIFTRGTLQDFAIALFVGLISGTYSSVFIASAFVYWWRRQGDKRGKKDQQKVAGPAKIKPVQA